LAFGTSSDADPPGAPRATALTALPVPATIAEEMSIVLISPGARLRIWNVVPLTVTSTPFTPGMPL
jgi:hypothetical protein